MEMAQKINGEMSMTKSRILSKQNKSISKPNITSVRQSDVSEPSPAKSSKQAETDELGLDGFDLEYDEEQAEQENALLQEMESKKAPAKSSTSRSQKSGKSSKQSKKSSQYEKEGGSHRHGKQPDQSHQTEDLYGFDGMDLY